MGGELSGCRVLGAVTERKEACKTQGSQTLPNRDCAGLWKEEPRTARSGACSWECRTLSDEPIWGHSVGLRCRVKRHSEMWTGEGSTDLKVVKEQMASKTVGVDEMGKNTERQGGERSHQRRGKDRAGRRTRVSCRPGEEGMSDHHSQSSGSPMGEAKIQKRKELS